MRQTRINDELPHLLHAYEVLRETMVGDIVLSAIEDLLLDTYADCTLDPETCTREDCCMGHDEMSNEVYDKLMDDVQIRRSVPDSEIDQASLPKVKYMPFNETTGITVLGTRMARKGWDNTLNQEYVQYAPLIGLVKVYQASSIRNIDADPKPYFKNVVHTYEPTNEDTVATDWYFL